MLRDVELVDEDDEDDVVARRVASNLRGVALPRARPRPRRRRSLPDRLTALCMLANAADAVEVLSVALVLPTAGAEFRLSDSDKGLLTSAIFAGALVGSILWGVLGDRVGRRPALAASMAVNALFALLSAASTSFPALVFCRAFAGLGVSGANAVVFTALPEFLPVSHRGFHVVLLASGWMFGSVYSAFVGWLVVEPRMATVSRRIRDPLRRVHRPRHHAHAKAAIPRHARTRRRGGGDVSSRPPGEQADERLSFPPGRRRRRRRRRRGWTTAPPPSLARRVGRVAAPRDAKASARTRGVARFRVVRAVVRVVRVDAVVPGICFSREERRAEGRRQGTCTPKIWWRWRTSRGTSRARSRSIAWEEE